MDKHWYKLLKDAVQSLSMEILKIELHMVLGDVW